jgi:YggT family protein
MITTSLDVVARILVVAALVYATAIVVTAWAVRSQRIKPFAPWPRFVRKLSDPVLRPLERQVVRRGGNPQEASLWLLGIVVVGGLILISLVQWLTGFSFSIVALAQSGPRAWVRFLVSAAFSLLMLALFIRVIASWFPISPHSGFMPPILALTDWLVDPIRRRLPPMGMIDMSPMVAWLILWLARSVVMGML